METASPKININFDLVGVAEREISPDFESYAMGDTFPRAVASLISSLRRDNPDDDTLEGTYYYTLENDGEYRFYEEEALDDNNIWSDVKVVLKDCTVVLLKGIYNSVGEYLYGVYSEFDEKFDVADVDKAYCILPDGKILNVQVNSHRDYEICN